MFRAVTRDFLSFFPFLLLQRFFAGVLSMHQFSNFRRTVMLDVKEFLRYPGGFYTRACK